MGEQMTMERRTLSEPVEFRTDKSGKPMIAGYGAVFNSQTNIGDAWVEDIAPGAFSETIKDDVRSLFDHNSALILGRTKSKTLRIWEDDRGLRYEVDLPETQAGKDLQVSMDRGDVDGSSFAFTVTHDEWNHDANPPRRTIHKVKLYEVGPVTFPAYPDAEVGLRSMQSSLEVREKAARQKNFNAAAKSLSMKTDLALRKRRGSKAE
jgi:HK97 family phage prohead protease